MSFILAAVCAIALTSADSSQYDPHLAYSAMSLSVCVFNEGEIKAELENHGFTRIKTYNHDLSFSELNLNRPTFAIAERGDEIAVIIRGTDTVSNWLTNVSVGSGTQHAGFTASKDYVLQTLRDFGEINENTVFFITGYSQGGAIANLLAAELTDEVGAERVFAYTFATPNVSRCITTEFTDYTNIFNICNTLDLAASLPTHVTGNEWQKYGRTVYFRQEVNSSSFLTHHRRTYLTVMSRLQIPCEEWSLGDITDKNTAQPVRNWDRTTRSFRLRRSSLWQKS
jgi:hypothetical protein